MEHLFLALLVIIMIGALASGFPVAFALPGSAIISEAIRICEYVAKAHSHRLQGNLLPRYGSCSAPPGNRTRVARMGILHDTTTPATL